MDRKKILHYEILERVGKGGMGEVYRALDTRLDREVALKFVPREACPEASVRQRLLSEARTASRLVHPNIVAIHAIEHENDEDFIVMEFVHGRPLSEIIRKGELSLPEILEIACDVAGGLIVAHEQGIVHRDIKTDNIMITPDGRVKVLDFGLAVDRRATRVTREDVTVGTVRYMSPEQARGDNVDRRTDVWALGVCLYEMIAGRPPFEGDHDQAILFQVVNQEPKPIRDYRPDVPDELTFTIETALAKDPGKRFQSAGDFCTAVQSARMALKRGETGERSSPEEAQPSVAVLPFTNMSPDPEQAFFCDGIAEDIINDLSHIDGLRVVSRTSSFAFKGLAEDIRSIGRKLGVTSLLEGSVRKAGNRIRVTAQLINVADGYHVWSKRYDRELKDVFSIQEEIAKHIAEALEIELSDKARIRVEKSATSDVEAYEFYLRGRRYAHRVYAGNLARALDMFRQAIEKDPEYALAYAGIADVQSFTYMYYNSTDEVLVEAMSAGQKALELDPDLAEAHSARGLALSLQRRWDEAEKEYERAIELNPQLYEAYYFYARMRFAQGENEKAQALFKKAHEVNPADYQAIGLLVNLLDGLGEKEETSKWARRGIDLVKRHVQVEPGDSRAWGMGALLYATQGEREKAIEWMERSSAITGDDSGLLYNVACLQVRLDLKDDAIDTLARAVDLGWSHREWIDNDPDFDPVREDPRFIEVVSKIR